MKRITLFFAILWFAFASLGATSPADAQDLTPEEAVKRMKVANGFEVKLVAAEPLVRQPNTMSFDDRGRLWVIQYLQYPFPKGLKPVHVDKYLRTKYDRVPQPPPQGPKGADKITILYDRDADGRFRKSKDFVTGLNLASGMALGHAGVFVAQPPYLLFYADKNGDDVPDGDPEVLLKGFGMEDSHAFANSLQWGPDGWLYGAHGSTSYANIRGISFVQGIWRYHPITKRFELFSEGGGNTYGLDFDRQGNAIAGTNFGRRAMLHQMQGAYYIKGFAKHGPLKNPHAYGYFDHIPYKGFQGGHVTCGGVVYQGGAFPEKFNNQYIAANPLSNFIAWHKMTKQGSTFTAEHGGYLIKGNDKWFRPIDCITGPDGAVYIADWYDKRITHHDPRDNWDRRNGRIYKLQPKGFRSQMHINPAKLSSRKLATMLDHANVWYRRQARRILAERRNKSAYSTLRKTVELGTGQLARESLWALHVSGGLTEKDAEKFLEHKSEEVRAWTVRLLGDENRVTERQREIMTKLAKTDPSRLVRSQLACTARRLPSRDAAHIVFELLQRDEDTQDPFLPNLLWWAVEQHAVTGRDDICTLLKNIDWKTPLVRTQILERIGRRYMAEGKDDFETCAFLLGRATDQSETNLLLRGMEKALQGKRLKHVPGPLQKPLGILLKDRANDLLVLRLAMRLGSEEAYERAQNMAANPKTAVGNRVALLQSLGEFAQKEDMPLFLETFSKSRSNRLRQAALGAMQSYRNESVTDAVLQAYPKLSGAVRNQAKTLLVSREKSALQLLVSIDRKKLKKTELSLDQLRQIDQFKNDRIKKLIQKHWGKIAPATADDKLGRLRHYNRIFSRGKGDLVRGRALFKKHCAICHQLHGEGNKVGPDLTGADRSNRAWLLMHIVDPNAVQRIEYANYSVVMKDGRVLTGVIPQSAPEAITLINAKNEKSVLPRPRIASLLPSAISLMPEKLLEPLNDQQFLDLFAFLQSKEPPTIPKDRRGSPDPAETPDRRSQNRPDKKLTVCLVSGSLEYDSDTSLAKLKKHLESKYNIRCSWAKRKAKDDLPGLKNLQTCDVAIFFTRRMTITGKQLDMVKKYCQSGKPIVAIRTASHGFQNWLEFDKLVLGGNYKGHFGNKLVCKVNPADSRKSHPILAGLKPFKSVGSLYKNTPINKDAYLLLNGSIPDHTEPVAWTHMHKGGRVFYTSLGHQRDFDNPLFLRLIANALYWTTKREAPK